MRPWFQPGVNVDKVDVEAGLQMASDLAYTDPHERMLISYALQRWARGEEEWAERMVLEGIDGWKVSFLNWRMILAAAIAATEVSCPPGCDSPFCDCPGTR
jgi:hypothetical protein